MKSLALFVATAVHLAALAPQAVAIRARSPPGPIKRSSIPFKKTSKAATASFGFENVNDIKANDLYTANITLGGSVFEVQLDTGSSDLWIDTTKVDLSSFQNTGINSIITYGDGTLAEGPILIGNVTFGGFTFPQAFISAPGSNATTNGDKGLLGLGPPSLSSISDSLSNTNFNGKTVMENVFETNPTTPTFMTFQLSRSESTGFSSGGIFTIGETDSSLSSVTNADALGVVSTQTWSVLMDGIIVNGQNFTGHSSFSAPGQSEGQTVAVLDTGTDLALIPTFYSDAIYANVPGAQFVSDQGIYIVPCDSQIQVSFVFGGQEFPIDPIDTVTAGLDSKGNVICSSGFPADLSDGEDGQDFLLGDSFMRNIYALFDFAGYIEGNNTRPFIQMISTTNAQSAASNFQSNTQQRNNSLTGKGDTVNPNSSGGGGSSSGALSVHSLQASLFALCVALGVSLL